MADGQRAPLETYEWIRIWWDRPEEAGPRVLLIGDSITEGYAPLVKERLSGSVHVDSYASSLALDNPHYLTQLKTVLTLSGQHYQAIHFNNGLHGLHLGQEAYAAQYEQAVALIRRLQPEAELILALSTPITTLREPDTLAKENEIVLARNDAVLRLADKAGLTVDPLYERMLGRAELRCEDGLHYTPEGQALQADTVAELLSRAL